MYGPVRTVVWQGSAGDRRPYADQWLISVLKSACESPESFPGTRWQPHRHGQLRPAVVPCPREQDPAVELGRARHSWIERCIFSPNAELVRVNKIGGVNLVSHGYQYSSGDTLAKVWSAIASIAVHWLFPGGQNGNPGFNRKRTLACYSLNLFRRMSERASFSRILLGGVDQ